MATRINRYLDSVSTFDNLEVDLIRPSDKALRRTVGRDFSELVDSIRENGLLQPIIVRPSGERFEVVAGNRRLEACRRLKHRKIKAMIADIDDKTAYEVSITENVQRRTLDPLEEAAAFKKYCDEYGWGSQSELAKKIGKSQEFVSHRIKLLELPEQVKSALTNSEITLSSAEELVWLKSDAARKKLATEFASRKLPMQGMRHIVKAVNSGEVSLQDFPAQGIPTHNENDLPRFAIGPREDGKEKNFSKTISESILILRIALVRLDDLVAKTEDPYSKQIIVSKRVAIHNLIDELISIRRHGPGIPALVVRK
jgi:ParB family transcriptional regulator, chromosome partitioning protein